MMRRVTLWILAIASVAAGTSLKVSSQTPIVPCVATRDGPDCKCCTTRTTRTFTTTNGCGVPHIARGQPIPFDLRPKDKQIYLYVQDASGHPVQHAVIEISLMSSSAAKEVSPGPLSSATTSCVTDADGVCSMKFGSAIEVHAISASCRQGCLGGRSEALVIR